MKVNICYSVIILLIMSCSNRISDKNIKITKADNLTYEGKLATDSIFEGPVKYYDSTGTYMGHTTYKNGYKEGVEVDYYKNGKIADSSFYRNNVQNGFAFKFDSNGILLYKSNYLNDLAIGHVYEYNKNGNVTRYYFVNFEHKIIYELYKVNGKEYREGDEIQMNLFSKGSSETNYLFLYLFESPFVPRHYELGILDSSNKIVSTKKISSVTCYYEQELLPLAKGQKYAVILYRYNALKKRDNVVIEIVQ